MITLSPGSLCDVCAEEYGPHNYPHSIPCGHILCAGCCNTIVQKTPTKLTPSCPFCREHFTSDTVRLIRIDFTPNGSGWSTPRQCNFEAAHDNIVDDTEDDTLSAGLRNRTEAKRLEYKVARVAAKKCSVEEVTALYKELQRWLDSEERRGEKTSSLHLSSALLRAILMNHQSHSEATKAHKTTESHLKDQLEDVEASKSKLETELRSLRSQYSQMAQDCQTLRAELSRYKVKSAAPVFGAPSTPASKTAASFQTSSGLSSPPRPQTTAPVSPTPSIRSRATSPTSPTPHAPSVHSPLASRMGSGATSVHSRSASVSASALHRSMTPSVRSGAQTPAVPLHRSESARPSTPYKSRTLSMSTAPPLPHQPTKMTRSFSNESNSDNEIQKEKERQKDAKRVQLIQRWIPSLESSSPPTGRGLFPSGIPTTHGSNTTGHVRSRTISTTASAAYPPPTVRYRTHTPANSP